MKTEKKSTNKNKIVCFVKKLEWQDYALAACIIIFLIVQANLLNSFQQLPSPLYGGDYYNQMGAVNHVKYGGNAFKSYATDDPIGSYLPIYSFLVGNYARLFNMSAMQAMYSFSYIITILAFLIVYWLGIVLFRNKSAALGSTLLFYSFTRIPIIKYRQFTQATLFPLFFVCLYLTIKKKDWKWAVASGLVLGVGALSHGSMFLYIMMLMPFLFLYVLLGQYVTFKNKKFSFNKKKALASWKKNFVLLVIILVIGLAIAMVYWYYPFKYMFSGDPHLKEVIDLSREQGRGAYYSSPLARAGNVFSVLLNHITRSSWLFILFSAFGILALIFIKKALQASKYIIFITVSTVIIFWHFLITKPLLGLQVPVHEMMSFIIPLLMFFFSGFFILILRNTLKKTFKNKKLVLGIIVFILLLILITNYIIYKDYVKNDRWINVGLSGALPEPLTRAADFIIKNTEVNDVILTNHELGFAINALTGRKLVSTPRGSHNSPIIDTSTRDAHLAVILYGSDDEERERLLKEYGVKYMFWTNYWLRGEFIFDQQGQVVGLFDPIEVLDKPKWREYLDSANVTYQPMNAELNPNKRGYAKKFDVLVVFPRMNITRPWSPSLDKYLELEFKYPSNTNPSVKIFKVNV